MKTSLRCYDYHTKSRVSLKAHEFSEYVFSRYQARVRAGAILIDAAVTRAAQIGRYEVRLAPWRTRGGNDISFGIMSADIYQPHTSDNCPFCDDQVLDRQAIAVIEAGRQQYYLMANYKPVGPEHMMLVKGKDSPNGDLAQIIHSPEELLALFDLQYLFPREFSFYFNSSPGGETASGASLDHWHWQMFRLGEAFKRLVPVPLWVGPDAARSVPGWPAQHRIFSPDQPTSARQLFKYAHVLHAANNAYNVFRGQLADGAGLTALFPRWRGTPVTEFMGHPAYPCHGVD